MNKIRELERLNREIHSLMIKSRFSHEKNRRLHPGQMPIMCVISENEGNTQKEIADRLGVSVATVGVSVARLEKAGLVVKKPDEKDGRTTRIELTERGAKCAGEAIKYNDAIAEIKYSGFSESEMTQLYELLSKAKNNLNRAFEKQDK